MELSFAVNTACFLVQDHPQLQNLTFAHDVQEVGVGKLKQGFVSLAIVNKHKGLIADNKQQICLQVGQVLRKKLKSFRVFSLFKLFSIVFERRVLRRIRTA